MFNDEQLPYLAPQRTWPASKYLAACLLALAPLCVSAAAQDEMKGEALYQQAVEMLEPVDGMMNSMLSSVYAGAAPTQFDEQKGAVRQIVTAATEKLQEASSLGHPVAQYRLALLYTSFLQDTPDTCELLNQSADQSFAPAAVLLAAECVPFETTPRHMAQLEKAIAEISRYTTYYPQPAVRLRCIAQPPEGALLQWGKKEDYLAELSMMLAVRSARHTAERAQYLNQAVAANGCAYAANRMGRRQ